MESRETEISLSVYEFPYKQLYQQFNVYTSSDVYLKKSIYINLCIKKCKYCVTKTFTKVFPRIPCPIASRTWRLADGVLAAIPELNHVVEMPQVGNSPGSKVVLGMPEWVA